MITDHQGDLYLRVEKLERKTGCLIVTSLLFAIYIAFGVSVTVLFLFAGGLQRFPFYQSPDADQASKLSRADLSKITGNARFHGPFFVASLYNGTTHQLSDINVHVKVVDQHRAVLLERDLVLRGPLPPLSGAELSAHSGQEFENLGPNGEHLSDTCTWRVVGAHVD